jgi:hypothetical protein
MASTFLACRHVATTPFRGMSMVERRDDLILFRCGRCLAEYSAVRCVSTTKKGVRCGGAALSGALTCRVHRHEEAVGLVGAGPR